MNAVKIDGVEYPADSLSEDAKAQITGLQAVDRRINDLREQMAILQMARLAYANNLKVALDSSATAPAAVEAAPAGEET
jgi:hypothetical protein